MGRQQHELTKKQRGRLSMYVKDAREHFSSRLRDEKDSSRITSIRESLEAMRNFHFNLSDAVAGACIGYIQNGIVPSKHPAYDHLIQESVHGRTAIVCTMLATYGRTSDGRKRAFCGGRVKVISVMPSTTKEMAERYVSGAISDDPDPFFLTEDSADDWRELDESRCFIFRALRDDTQLPAMHYREFLELLEETDPAAPPRFEPYKDEPEPLLT